LEAGTRASLVVAARSVGVVSAVHWPQRAVIAVFGNIVLAEIIADCQIDAHAQVRAVVGTHRRDDSNDRLARGHRNARTGLGAHTILGVLHDASVGESNVLRAEDAIDAQRVGTNQTGETRGSIRNILALRKWRRRREAVRL